MDKIDTVYTTKQSQKILYNTYYYSNIFKKTEKICLAIQYLLHKETLHTTSETVFKDIESAVRDVHTTVLETLGKNINRIHDVAELIQIKLTILESKLRLGVAVGVIQNEHFSVFSVEIDAVFRSLQRAVSTQILPDFNSSMVPQHEGRTLVSASQRGETGRKSEKAANTIPSGDSSEGRSLGESRTDRILSILRSKGQATIKDLSDSIKDCSEKTIQRDLNKLIDKSIVLREGERRWSKYSII